MEFSGKDGTPTGRPIPKAASRAAARATDPAIAATAYAGAAAYAGKATASQAEYRRVDGSA